MIRIPPDPEPTGWWLDAALVRLYHGTTSTALASIAEHGLVPAAGQLFMTPSYQTAKDYSLFGPDGGDRRVINGIRAGGKIQLHPPHAYAVVHVELPRSYVQEHGQYRPETAGCRYFAIAERKLRLQDRTRYDQTEEPAETFYQWTEVYFPTAILPASIRGYSLPYVAGTRHARG